MSIHARLIACCSPPSLRGCRRSAQAAARRQPGCSRPQRRRRPRPIRAPPSSRRSTASSSKTCACRRSTASTRSRAARTSATSPPTAATPSSATCTTSIADANLSENRRRGIRARIIEAVPESEMLVYLAEGSEVHDHGVHRHRLRLLPPAAFADRRIQPARHPRALPVLPALGSRHRVVAQGRGRVVRVEPQRRAHARQERRDHQVAQVPRGHRRARLRARTQARPSTARRPSSWRG